MRVGDVFNFDGGSEKIAQQFLIGILLIRNVMSMAFFLTESTIE